MAQLPDVFKPGTADRSQFEPLPAGKYLAEIISSEYKANASKTGRYLTLTFKIVSEEGAGRRVFHLLNLDNPNETAVAIARRELDDIMLACGLDEEDDVDDSDQLHGIEMCVTLGIQEASAQWPAKNVIKKFELADEFDG